MKKTLPILLFLIFTGVLVGQLKISQYPNTNNLASAQRFIVTAGGTNMNITWAQLLSIIGRDSTNFSSIMVSNDMIVLGTMSMGTFNVNTIVVTNSVSAASGSFTNLTSTNASFGVLRGVLSVSNAANSQRHSYVDDGEGWQFFYGGDQWTFDPAASSGIPHRYEMTNQIGGVSSNGVVYKATNINFVGNTKMTNVNGTMSVDVTPGGAATLPTPTPFGHYAALSPTDTSLIWVDRMSRGYLLDDFSVQSSATVSGSLGVLTSSSTPIGVFGTGPTAFNPNFVGGWAAPSVSSSNAANAVGALRYANAAGITNWIPSTNTILDVIVGLEDTPLALTNNCGTPMLTNTQIFIGLGTSAQMPMVQLCGIGALFRPFAAGGCPNWMLMTKNSSGTQTNTSGWLVDTNVTYRLTIVCDTNAGTVSLLTNGVLSVVNNANIPVGLGMMPIALIGSTSGLNGSITNRHKIVLSRFGVRQ